MLRLDELEQLGVRCAAISDRADGDCRLGPEGDEARRRFLESLGIETPLATLNQVHGCGVIDVSDAAAERLAGDALIADRRGVALGISVADCVPVWIVDPRRCGALVHAGREGTRLQVTRKAAEALCARCAAHPGDLHAFIGPSAGPCCYEVSPELAAQCAAEGIPTQGRMLDLWQANAMQLTAFGVPPAQVRIAGICTICDTRFHSHRRDANGARNLAVLML